MSRRCHWGRPQLPRAQRGRLDCRRLLTRAEATSTLAGDEAIARASRRGALDLFQGELRVRPALQVAFPTALTPLITETLLT